jgi:hypothetical protein
MNIINDHDNDDPYHLYHVLFPILWQYKSRFHTLKIVRSRLSSSFIFPLLFDRVVDLEALELISFSFYDKSVVLSEIIYNSTATTSVTFTNRDHNHDMHYNSIRDVFQRQKHLQILKIKRVVLYDVEKYSLMAMLALLVPWYGNISNLRHLEVTPADLDSKQPMLDMLSNIVHHTSSTLQSCLEVIITKNVLRDSTV